jgi:hypothetical protein
MVPWKTACFGIKTRKLHVLLLTCGYIFYSLNTTTFPFSVCTVYTIAVEHTGVAVYILRLYVNSLALEPNAPSGVQKIRTEMRSP